MGWSIYAATVKAARTGAIEQVDVDTLEKVSGGHQLLPPVSSTELADLQRKLTKLDRDVQFGLVPPDASASLGLRSGL